MKPNKYKSKLYRKNNNTCRGATKGWDYTPLFKFLLSKVGGNWNSIYSEILPRINDRSIITWMIDEEQDYVRVNESTYFSSLYIDEEGLLQIVNKSINENSLEPSCDCCTHTFNGKLFTKKYKEKSILEREFVGNLRSKIEM